MISIPNGAQKREFERNQARQIVLIQLLNPEAKITIYSVGRQHTQYHQKLRDEELKIVQKMSRAEQEQELARINEFFARIVASNTRKVPQEGARAGNGLEAVPPGGDA